MSIYEVDKLISEARRIAAEYRRTTGKSLPLSNEIARHDACVYLALEPASEQDLGYDATDKQGHRIQVKARAIFDESRGGQRLGQLKLEQDWDAVAMVLMNENFETTEIYLASRQAVLDTMDNSSESSRSKRGAMSVARFKHISQLVWTAEDGLLSTDEVWAGQPAV